MSEVERSVLDRPRGRTVEIFWVRWAAASPVSEWWLGGAVAGVLSALNYLMWTLSEPAVAPDSFLVRLPYAIAISTGYLVAVVPYSIRKTRADLEDLREYLDCSDDEFAAAQARVSRQDPRWVLRALVAAIALPAVIQEFIAGRAYRFVTGLGLGVWDIWSLILPILLWFTLFCAMLVTISQIRTMRLLGLHHVELWLFDRDATRPFVRFGLRAAALGVVGPLVFIALSLAADALYPPAALSTYTVGAVLAALGFLAPLSGLRRRIREAKREQIARVDRAIRGHRAVFADPDVTDESDALRLGGLLVYRREVEAIPEWPLDAPALRRFALYLVLPLASWVAAAFVEQLVAYALQRGS